MKVGDIVGGFVVERVVNILDIRVCAFAARHSKTGAGLIHLHSDDTENLFAIAFKTPPWDGTGLPHIVEHSVLAGSQRYPLKDVFNELIKGSLQTFLNAFTYPDKTVFPVASNIKREFFNLASVYSDLVFHPRLLRQTFWQEAHHRRFNDTGGMDISGVVYNEMKGAYSSADSLASKALQENLYPDTPYRFDAGGDPEEIPHLTFERFREYHQKHYNPGNCLFFTYGNIEAAEQLLFVDSILQQFEGQNAPAAIAIPRQESWGEPRTVTAHYPLGEREKATAMVNIAWMLHEATEIKNGALLSLLSSLLLGSPASPLRQALLASRLGEDLTSASGAEQEMRQAFFCVGLRGVKLENVAKVEALTLNILEEIAATGFDAELVEGIFHQSEFVGREITRRSYPRGIVLMGTVLQQWLYGGDALAGLNFPALIAAAKEELQSNPRLFSESIERWLLHNPHRLTVRMLPSATMLSEREESRQRKMQAIVASLSHEQKREIATIASEIDTYQSEENSPESLETLPLLDIADVSCTVEKIPAESEYLPVNAKQPENTVLFRRQNIFTNGICYASIAFDLSAVSAELVVALPLLAKSITKLGAQNYDYEQMAKRIARYTGGITASVVCGMRLDGTLWRRLVIGVKALAKNVQPAMAVLGELLLSGRLDEDRRIEELILEAKNGLAMALVPSGHMFARMSALAGISECGALEEIWGGKRQLEHLTNIAEAFATRGGDAIATLKSLRESVLRRHDVVVNVTDDDASSVGIVAAEAQALVAGLPSEGNAGRGEVCKDVANIAVSVPADVCFVAKAMTAPGYSHPLAPFLLVLSQLLSNSYLYQEVRAVGGAYGGFASYDAGAGSFALISYRDPHLTRTMEVFEKTPDALVSLLTAQAEVKKAIISTAGRMEKPSDPAGKGYTSLIRHFAGLDDEKRQRFRDAVLSTRAEDLKTAADYLFSQGRYSYGIYGPEKKLKTELAGKGFTFR